MIQGNWIGLGMFVIVGIIVAIGSIVLKLPDFQVMISAGAALIIIDLIMRLLKRNQQGWLMGKQFGGYLYFAPVWIFGIIVIAVNIINVIVNRK